MVIDQLGQTLTARNETHITHHYLFPHGIIETIVPDGKSRFGANGFSLGGRLEGVARYLGEELPLRFKSLHLFEELFAMTGIVSPNQNLDNIFLMGSYRLPVETARRLADDYSSVDGLVMLSDKMIGKEEELRIILTAEFTNLEFYWLPQDQQQEIADKIMAEIGSDPNVSNMFHIIFGSFVTGDDKRKYVSELLAHAEMYIQNPGALDPIWGLFFAILEHTNQNAWAFISSDQYQSLRARARKRVDSVDIISLGYFPGMKPEEVQRFAIPDYTFSDALSNIKARASIEPFKDVIAAIADLYFKQIAEPAESARTDAHDKAMNKLAYFALRKAIPLEQLKDKLQGNPIGIARKIYDYTPSLMV